MLNFFGGALLGGGHLQGGGFLLPRHPLPNFSQLRGAFLLQKGLFLGGPASGFRHLKGDSFLSHSGLLPNAGYFSRRLLLDFQNLLGSGLFGFHHLFECAIFFLTGFLPGGLHFLGRFLTNALDFGLRGFPSRSDFVGVLQLGQFQLLLNFFDFFGSALTGSGHFLSGFQLGILDFHGGPLARFFDVQVDFLQLGGGTFAGLAHQLRRFALRLLDFLLGTLPGFEHFLGVLLLGFFGALASQHDFLLNLGLDLVGFFTLGLNFGAQALPGFQQLLLQVFDFRVGGGRCRGRHPHRFGGADGRPPLIRGTAHRGQEGIGQLHVFHLLLVQSLEKTPGQAEQSLLTVGNER